MNRAIQLLVVGLAIAVNAGALAIAHAAMGQITEREKLALQQPARIVVIARRTEHVAARACPAPVGKVL